MTGQDRTGQETTGNDSEKSGCCAVVDHAITY
jgi:hypothetical protein